MENYFQKFIDNLDQEKAGDSGVDSQVDPLIDRSPVSRVSTPDITPSQQHKRVVARLAIYDSLRVTPRIIELDADDYDELINVLATKTYQSAKEIGGNMPYTIIREIIENLIHSYFKEVVISVLDNGNTVRISDQGPGIRNKEKAFEPGFSTATTEMKRFIKGVGSGLPITKETLSFLGGAISIEDNLERGSVITLKVPSTAAPGIEANKNVTKEGTSSIDLNERQRKVLFLVMEMGSTGPSKIASELSISLSTAYRDLIYLEEKSLITSDEQGKRVLTSLGIEYLDEILNS